MQLHKTIRLSELPLSGKIVEQSSNVLVTNNRHLLLVLSGCKRGRPTSTVAESRRKKTKVPYSDCDIQEDLSKVE